LLSGNAIDEQDDRLALVGVTVATVVVVVREEGSNSEAILNFSSRTSAEKGIIPLELKCLAARTAAAVLSHESEKIVQNLAFLIC
jgi:hypothetical protein